MQESFFSIPEKNKLFNIIPWYPTDGKGELFTDLTLCRHSAFCITQGPEILGDGITMTATTITVCQ